MHKKLFFTICHDNNDDNDNNDNNDDNNNNNNNNNGENTCTNTLFKNYV